MRGFRVLARLRGNDGDGAPEARNDAGLAENDHGFEERRSNRAADDGDARGVDEQASLDAFSRGELAKSVVAGVVAPVRQRVEGVGELGKKIRHLGIFPEFRAGFRVVIKIIGEKCARPMREIR